MKTKQIISLALMLGLSVTVINGCGTKRILLQIKRKNPLMPYLPKRKKKAYQQQNRKQRKNTQ